MIDHPLVHSQRLTLRPLRPEDRDRLIEIQRTPEVYEWWGPVREDDFLGSAGTEEVELVIVIKGRVAGLIQYSEELDPSYRSAGIDIFLDPAFHGSGYGREALLLVIHHLIDTRGHHRLTIDPGAANHRAIAVYESVGFRRVGVMRQYERDPNGKAWHDGLLMDLLAGEVID